MKARSNQLRDDARRIWQSGVDAVSPERLMARAVRVRGRSLHVGPLRLPLDEIGSIAVVGAGKAGAAMSRAVEELIGPRLAAEKNLRGSVNVPDRSVVPLPHIHLHGARSAPDNKPTEAGVAGARKIRSLVESLGSKDLLICLLSGGGSALLPAPVPGITLSEKQSVTGMLHACGATIGQLNTVRKHLSELKGGGLVRCFRGKWLVSLIISDVVGDPLDVIASGPTAADRSTYRDAVEVFRRFDLWDRVPDSVRKHFEAGVAGRVPETLKKLPGRVTNTIIGNNATALEAAERTARRLGYRTVNLSSYLEGDSRELGMVLAGIARGVRERCEPVAAPACILSGGETTVALGPGHGLGGRNQELALAALLHLGQAIKSTAVLSGGTDGEDGPTDAAGAVADERVLQTAAQLKLDSRQFLDRHDSYHFFDRTGGLIKTGLTNTNVMDLRVVLIDS